MILSKYPRIDLHGFDREYASIVVRDFIRDNYDMKNKHILIIHGKGSGILREKIHQDLKKNKLVLEYRLNMFNSGETLVLLKEKKD